LMFIPVLYVVVQTLRGRSRGRAAEPVTASGRSSPGAAVS
jgi:hypothetical protein